MLQWKITNLYSKSSATKHIFIYGCDVKIFFTWMKKFFKFKRIIIKFQLNANKIELKWHGIALLTDQQSYIIKSIKPENKSIQLLTAHLIN